MTVWALLIEVISWGFILAGSAFVLIGAYGILKFRDFWARLHAFSVMDSGGVILLLIGMAPQAGPTLIAVELLIIGIFLFITGPTATHAMANAAFVSGLRPKEGEGLVCEIDDPKPEDAADVS